MSEKSLPKVEIYTDGACKGNPGPGGWAAILKRGQHEKEISGFSPRTTNNRMELTAAIEGLKALKYPCQVTLYSDSAYLINSLTKGWLQCWKRHGWKRGPRKNEPVSNVDLWQKLDPFLQKHQVKFVKLKGHSGHRYNERVDRLAVEQIKNGME